MTALVYRPTKVDEDGRQLWEMCICRSDEETASIVDKWERERIAKAYPNLVSLIGLDGLLLPTPVVGDEVGEVAKPLVAPAAELDQRVDEGEVPGEV